MISKTRYQRKNTHALQTHYNNILNIVHTHCTHTNHTHCKRILEKENKMQMIINSNCHSKIEKNHYKHITYALHTHITNTLQTDYAHNITTMQTHYKNSTNILQLQHEKRKTNTSDYQNTLP